VTDASAPAPPSGVHERLLGSIPGVLALLDADGIVRFASGQLEEISGRSVDEVLGTRLDQFVVESDRGLLEALIRQSASLPGKGGLLGPVRMPFIHSDGSKRIAEAWSLNRIGDPELNGIVVLLLPESTYDHFDQVLVSVMAGGRLDDSLSELANALAFRPVQAECYFVVAAGDGRRIDRWPEREAVPGPPLAGPWGDVWERGGASLHPDLSHLPTDTRVAAKAAGFAAVSAYPVASRVDGSRATTLVAWFHEAGPVPLNSQIALERALTLASLVISHDSSSQTLRDEALRDPLTGLSNRRRFFEALGARVEAGDCPAVLYIDLDGFKDVNDRLGHLAGDSALRVLSRRLASVVRPTDELARLGGDEFAVICGGEVTEQQVVAIASRVTERLAEPLTVGDAGPMSIGASVGIALAYPSRTPADTLLAIADGALYEAKAAGGGTWKVSTGG